MPLGHKAIAANKANSPQFWTQEARNLWLITYLPRLKSFIFWFSFCTRLSTSQDAMILFCIHKHRFLNCIWWQRDTSLLNSHQLKMDLRRNLITVRWMVISNVWSQYPQLPCYKEVEYQHMPLKGAYHWLPTIGLWRIWLCIIGSKDASIIRIWVWVCRWCLQ